MAANLYRIVKKGGRSLKLLNHLDGNSEPGTLQPPIHIIDVKGLGCGGKKLKSSDEGRAASRGNISHFPCARESVVLNIRMTENLETLPTNKVTPKRVTNFNWQAGF